MNTTDSFAQAQNQLYSLPSDVTLAILHPDFHGQHRLLTPVLGDSSITLVFVTIPEANFSLDNLLAHIRVALETQLNADVPDLRGNADAAARQLAKVLNRYDGIMLGIDAYDLARRDEVAPFIASLAQNLSAGSRIVLGTRELPMELLGHDGLQGRIALVPTNPDRMLLDYAQSQGKSVLEVRALGPGRVLINGRLVDHWDGVLPRTLFFYFVDRGMTTRDEIFQTFWPTLSTREATNVFHVTKRKISEILGTDLTVYWSGFYRISPDLELHYDVVKFVEAVQNAAVADDNDAISLLQNAIDLYNGPFLSTMEQDWVTNRRGELALTYAEALSGLARIYKNRDEKVNALGCFLRAAATSPQREDLARAIMELYRDLNLPSEALETYDRLVMELKNSLNVAPGAKTTELAEQIRRS